MLFALVVFELIGRIEPPARASVTLHGATTPFAETTLSDAGGRFRFRKLETGAYTLSAFAPGRGEASQTIEIGPNAAGPNGRIEVSLELRATGDNTGTVSLRALAIPDKARKQYDEAQKKLARRDVPAAIAHLERALEIAPEFAAAWNNLGTIAYQTQRYPEAEVYFRRGLRADPQAFAPLVNLGGVLLTLNRVDESLKYNLYAVLARPGDALANSQLGLSYFAAGNLELARKYLEKARNLDPAHFSHPQLTLAEIHLRQGRRGDAAIVLEDFLARHPDWEKAAEVRESITRLKEGW